MNSRINIKARLERYAKNKEFFSKNNKFLKNSFSFKLISLTTALILPIYPSFGAYGEGNSDMVTWNYDESSIISSYDDSNNDGGTTFSNDSGFVKTTELVDDSRNLSGVNQITDYKIENGDSLSAIADKFGISINSIVWANDINSNTVLKPGQTIKVPPVSGVIHTVAEGDTTKSISEKYGVSEDKILKQNNIVAGSGLSIGVQLIIPDGKKVAPKQIVDYVFDDGSAQKVVIKKPQLRTYIAPKNNSTKSSTQKILAKSSYSKKSGYNGFAWGNCTYFVAQNKKITWRGNARDWLRNARAQGVPTGSNPQVGAILVNQGAGYNPYYGHVGIVVGVDGDDLIVKDMNYRRLNEVTVRKINKNDRTIRGYIYAEDK